MNSKLCVSEIQLNVYATETKVKLKYHKATI